MVSFPPLFTFGIDLVVVLGLFYRVDDGTAAARPFVYSSSLTAALNFFTASSFSSRGSPSLQAYVRHPNSGSTRRPARRPGTYDPRTRHHAVDGDTDPAPMSIPEVH